MPAIAESLESRQMLSGSAATARGPLTKLDASLQGVYQSYQQYIATQLRSQNSGNTGVQTSAQTKAQARAFKKVEAAALLAASRSFQPADTALHASKGSIPIQAFANRGDRVGLISALKKFAGEQVASTGREIDATIPIADLDELARLKSLRFAEASASVVNVGLVTSQGDTADQAASARAAYAINGAGIKIGIISDSFNNNINPSVTDTYSTDVATGDLPAGVQILSDNVPGTDEGRAIAQVIYDSAPGVSLEFATGEANGGADGQATMAANIASLSSNGAKIIVDDITYQNEPMFADGKIAQAAETAISRGITYISAAGNLGSNSYASAWRSGAVLSAGAIAKDPSALNAPTFYGGTSFNFASSGNANNTESFTLAPGQIFNPSLQWDSPYYSTGSGSGTSNQLDIYVLNSSGTMVEGGSSALVTGGDPIQLFKFQNSTSTTQTYKLMICCSIGAVPGYIKYIDFGGSASNWQYAQGAGTIFGHANASGVESVGAVSYASTPAYGVTPPALESYSGTGGTPIIFTTAGTRLPSFGYRQSPEVVAPDAVSTTFFGALNAGSHVFTGTSAAAAEVTGLAALLLQKDPKFTPAQVNSAINSNTIQMGASSPNNQSGTGLIQSLPVISNSVGNISGTVFSDNNANAIFDQSETPLANAIVYIDVNNVGTLVSTDPVATTSTNGSFAFYNQSLGSTIVRVIPLSGYVLTNPSQTVNVLGATTISGVYLGMFPTLFAGTAGNYNYTLQTDATKPGIFDIFVGNTLAYTAPLSLVQGGLTFDLEGGNASLTVSFANGNTIPNGGVSFTPTGSGNTLVFNGSASADTVLIDGSTSVFSTGSGGGSGGTVSASGIESEIINGAGGNDKFTVATAQPANQSLTFNGSPTLAGNTTLNVNDPLPAGGTTTYFNAGLNGADQNTLNVNKGTWTFLTNPALGSTNLTVNDSSNVMFASASVGSGINTRQLLSLNISAGSTASISAGAAHADRDLLVLNSLTIASNGILDLNSNDLIITTGSSSAIVALLASGFNGGNWNGTGIRSSAAAVDPMLISTLGEIRNRVNGVPLYGSGGSLGLFDGFDTPLGAILVKYTYYGDSNLDGKVDGSDYSNIDSSSITPTNTGWFNGDFNYDGSIDGSDYTLLDNAFNAQGPQL